MYKRAVYVLPVILFVYCVIVVVMMGSNLRRSNGGEFGKLPHEEILLRDVDKNNVATSRKVGRKVGRSRKVAGGWSLASGGRLQAEPLPFFDVSGSAPKKGKYEHRRYPGIPLTGALLAPRPWFRYGALALGPGIIIGVPTVQRENASYLLDTLQSLLAADQLEKHPGLRVVVYIGDVDMLNFLKTASEIANKFPAQLSGGRIEVISPPSNYFPNWDETITPGFNDTFEQTKWRSKQNLDQIFLMMYIYNLRPDYYLMMEDDVIASKDYASKIMEFVEKTKRYYWFYLSFAGLGAIGKLFRVNTLPSYASFIHTFWNKKPLDWLQKDYARTMVCSYDEPEESCDKRRKLVTIERGISLFQHIGKVSSLKGKLQKLQETKVDEITPPLKS